ncbi:hypothetical protein HAX54_004111, partial [Datura stramonium]|nr:hypothetical protein [Datura stramonium]
SRPHHYGTTSHQPRLLSADRPSLSAPPFPQLPIGHRSKHLLVTRQTSLSLISATLPALSNVHGSALQPPGSSIVFTLPVIVDSTIYLSLTASSKFLPVLSPSPVTDTHSRLSDLASQSPASNLKSST